MGATGKANGSVVDRVIFALGISSSLGHEAWVALNETANALLDREGYEAAQVAQVGFSRYRELVEATPEALFPGTRYPHWQLTGDARTRLVSALLGAREKYGAAHGGIPPRDG